MSAPNLITTGHDAEGKAVFVESVAFKPITPHVGLVYRALADGPVNLNDDADLKALAEHDPAAVGIVPKAGHSILMVEWPPSSGSADKMHRTLSVDIGVMMQGEIECHLDGGEKRTIKQGEILMQRGTNHYWINPSSTVTAKMIMFVVPSKPIDVLEH